MPPDKVRRLKSSVARLCRVRWRRLTEAARLYEIPIRTLRRHVEAHNLPTTKFRGVVYVDDRQCADMIAEARIDETPKSGLICKRVWPHP